MPNEWRVVCAHHGNSMDHRSHTWGKRDQAKAEQSVIDLDHKAQQNADAVAGGAAKRWYADEAPYRVQVREVGEWADES